MDDYQRDYERQQAQRDHERQQADAASRADAAYQAGSSGSDFHARTFAEGMAHWRGRENRGSGARIHIVALLLASAVIPGFWPVAGIIGAVAGLSVGYGLKALLPADPRWVILWGIAGVISGILAFGLGRKVESGFETFGPYRIFRHLVRILWVGLLLCLAALASPFSRGSHEWPAYVTWSWLDSRLTPLLLAIIVGGMIVMHFYSRKHDRSIEADLNPARADGREDNRVERFARTKVAFYICTPLGIAAALLHGDPFIGSIFSGIILGLVGALIYFLYRLARDAFAR